MNVALSLPPYVVNTHRARQNSRVRGLVRTLRLPQRPRVFYYFPLIGEFGSLVVADEPLNIGERR
jgi:hypothetical protein